MTARRLCLVRHAEAVPPTSADADRPLTARGADDASRAGRWLAERGVVPDAVVVSPALRTRQTWARLAEALPGALVSGALVPGGLVPDVDPRLYRNTLDDYLDVVRDTADDARVLVVVGHNPSVAALAGTLLGGPPPDFPPGARALLELAVDWRYAGLDTATLLDAAAP